MKRKNLEIQGMLSEKNAIIQEMEHGLEKKILKFKERLKN